MRDEQIVLYRRRGLADFEIARELGHFVHVVIAALARAEALGIAITPIAATAEQSHHGRTA
jgi:hypothetical protein